MHKPTLYILFFLLLNMPALFAQQKDTTSLVAKNKTDTLKEKKHLSFYLGFDSRQSFISGVGGKIFGLRIGMQYAEDFRFGIGFYNLTNPIVVNDNYIIHNTIHKSNGKDSIVSDTGKLITNYSYSTLFAEPILLHKKRWEISLPVMIGSGKITLSSKNEDGTIKPVDAFSAPLAEVDLAGYYKIFPWVGIGVGAGYRTVLTKNKDIRKAYSAPLYIVKIKIFVNYIYRLVFPKKHKG